MLYGWNEVNSEDRRNVSEKKCYDLQKLHKEEKIYKFTEKIETNAAIIAMWLIL